MWANPQIAASPVFNALAVLASRESSVGGSTNTAHFVDTHISTIFASADNNAPKFGQGGAD
jgi:hypothetical protein